MSLCYTQVTGCYKAARSVDELNVTFTSVRDFIRTLRNTGNKVRSNKKESHRIPKKEVD